MPGKKRGIVGCTCCNCDPDPCATDDCDISQTEWEIGTGFDPAQEVRYSATVSGLYTIDVEWMQDAIRGVEAPSVKFDGTYSIDTSGVTGSVTVFEYLKFDDIIPVTLDEPITSITLCANLYGSQKFTGEDGAKLTFPLSPAIILEQDGKLFVNYGSDTPINSACFPQWSKTIPIGSFQRFIPGESDTSFTSEHPDPYGYAGDIQVGIGLFHQISIDELGTSPFKSLVSKAHFDNLCVKVNRGTWLCFPRCPDETDLIVTISGSSATMGGTCSPAHADTDGTFVCVPGTYGTVCLNTYPNNPSPLFSYGEKYWDCSDGDLYRAVTVVGEYPNALAHPAGGDGSIDVWLYFVSDAGFPIGFIYRTTDPFDCQTPLTLSLLGKTLSYPGSSTAWYPGVDNHTFTTPDITITVPATVIVEKA